MTDRARAKHFDDEGLGDADEVLKMEEVDCARLGEGVKLFANVAGAAGFGRGWVFRHNSQHV